MVCEGHGYELDGVKAREDGYLKITRCVRVQPQRPLSPATHTPPSPLFKLCSYVYKQTLSVYTVRFCICSSCPHPSSFIPYLSTSSTTQYGICEYLSQAASSVHRPSGKAHYAPLVGHLYPTPSEPLHPLQESKWTMFIGCDCCSLCSYDVIARTIA